jgi:hypothetical protein
MVSEFTKKELERKQKWVFWKFCGILDFRFNFCRDFEWFSPCSFPLVFMERFGMIFPLFVPLGF